MISKATAFKIWTAYNEIEKADKLIDVMKKNIAEEKPVDELKDAFGNDQAMKLSVPSGPASHTLYGVGPELALKVIEAHRADGEKRLRELETICLIELKK